MPPLQQSRPVQQYSYRNNPLLMQITKLHPHSPLSTRGCGPAAPHSRLIAACSGIGSSNPGIRRRARHENSPHPPRHVPLLPPLRNAHKAATGERGAQGRKTQCSNQGTVNFAQTRAHARRLRPHGPFPPPARVMYNPHSHAHFDDLAWRL